jgi:hypothetical protein
MILHADFHIVRSGYTQKNQVNKNLSGVFTEIIFVDKMEKVDFSSEQPV